MAQSDNRRLLASGTITSAVIPDFAVNTVMGTLHPYRRWSHGDAKAAVAVRIELVAKLQKCSAQLVHAPFGIKWIGHLSLAV